MTTTHHHQPILEIKNLSKSFGGLQAVQNCSFTVEPNTIVGLIGPNGAGKTTAFDLITGLMESDTGQIFFHDHEMTNWAAWKRANLGIGRTFQLVRLWPELTVIENLLIILHHEHQRLRTAFWRKRSEEKHLHDRAMELLHEVNLHEKAHLYARQLSYGQQKLLEIMRAVATDADLLLFDEPASGVNLTMLRQIEELFRHLKTQGKTLLIVEHNMPFVMGLCEKIVVLDHGKEIAVGKPEEIQRNPDVLEAYLGRRK